jgi:TadE-like protein
MRFPHLNTRALSRFASDDEGGVSTLEFIILAPVIFFMFFATFEAGWLMVRQTMLDRGLDMAMREVRLNLAPGITHQELKERVCEEAIGISNCSDSLYLELKTEDEAKALDPPSGRLKWPRSAVTCLNKGELIDPVVDEASFGSTGPDVIMIVVACAIVDPIVPGLGALMPGLMVSVPEVGNAAQDGYRMISIAAYKAEPDK